MREKTRTRLLALLEDEYAKLKAYNEADFLGDHSKKEQETKALFQEWRLCKRGDPQRDEILEKMERAQRERDKFWRAWEEQTKKYEASVKEEYALKGDIEDLKEAFSQVRVRP